MEQRHPPYLPTAILQPRLIIRWLDINYQNANLSRNQTFFIIPAFSVPTNTWLGYSKVLAIFSYVSPNSFSIGENPIVGELLTDLTAQTDFSEIPFLVCVSFFDDNGLFQRYKLNSEVGEVIYFGCTQYTNQVIPNTFNIEIWDTPNSSIQALPTITLYTSVQGSLDYRYGVDIPLFGVKTVTFNLFTPNLNLPFIFGATSTPTYLTDDQGNVLTDDQGNPILA